MIQVQISQRDQVLNLCGNSSAEGIVMKVQIGQRGQFSNLCRNSSAEGIILNAENGQGGQFSNLFRNSSSEGIVTKGQSANIVCGRVNGNSKPITMMSRSQPTSIRCPLITDRRIEQNSKYKSILEGNVKFAKQRKRMTS